MMKDFLKKFIIEWIDHTSLIGLQIAEDILVVISVEKPVVKIVLLIYLMILSRAQ